MGSMNVRRKKLRNTKFKRKMVRVRKVRVREVRRRRMRTILRVWESLRILVDGIGWGFGFLGLFGG